MSDNRTNDIDVSVIVVTHGAREMTLACLESLAQRDKSVRSEVIVVDNASPDALAGEIASRHSDIHLIPQTANLGFAVAANLGAEMARGRYLLFLNPDTLTERDAITRVLKFARSNPLASPLGVRTRFDGGNLNPISCRRKPTAWRLLCSGLGLDTRFPTCGILSGMAYPALPDMGAFPVDIVCGVCLLVERAVWNRLGGFSPAFFMYGEDDDFSLRATQMGCSPTLALDIAIVHHGSGTERDQARKLCQLLAARALIVRGYLAAPVRPVGRAFLCLRPFLGKHFGKPELRELWQKVWARRRLWLSGRFA